jgi:alkylated DNA repair protein alkB family protein 8
LKADDTSETSNQEIEEFTGNSAVSRDDSVKLKVNASRNVFEQQDLLIPWHYRGQKSCVNSSKTCAVDKHMVEQDEQELKSAGEDKVPKVYQRFYHVFKENELEEECRKLDDISVVRFYYDKGNWCVELEKVGNY